jgi:hypothetical protein
MWIEEKTFEIEDDEKTYLTYILCGEENWEIIDEGGDLLYRQI